MPSQIRSHPRCRAGWLVSLFCAASAAAAPTIQFTDFGDPTGEEQFMLELTNRARLGPAQEGIFLTNQTDLAITQSYTFFGVNKSTVQSAFAAIPSTQPLAMSGRLLAAARTHSVDMLVASYQGHRNPGDASESNPGFGVSVTVRLNNVLYSFNAVSENVYAAVGGPVPSILYAHVGLNIDWGVPSLDHRKSIMALNDSGPPAFDYGLLREVGIGVQRRNSVLPGYLFDYFITQDFARSPTTTNTPFLVGVVYTDLDADGFYSPGEGSAGVTVIPGVGDFYAVTSTSGGYAIPLQNLPPGASSVSVTFSGGALGTRQVVRTVALNGSNNVKSDVVVQADTATRLINLSTRLRVETGANVGIGGFVVTGTTPKQILVRALGPSLTPPPFNVTGAMSNPTLQIFDASSHAIAQNDNWQTPVALDPLFPPASAAAIAATSFAPSNSNESAILLTLPPGAYTGIVSGVGGEMGIALIEVYDVSLGNLSARAINVSTRGRVLTGDAVMIGGFVLQGNRSRRVVIRALGPSLAAFGVQGVLSDPSIQLFSGQNVVASNDNWRSGPSVAELQTIGRAPTDDREAAMIVTLAPGAYTVIVSGAGTATGVALVEIFDAEEL